MSNHPLIIISGATGVGKTELSVQLAKLIGGEIISADSMQVYKRFNIGTAKILPQEMNGIKHHLIDILEPEDEFNIFMFKKLADSAIEEIRSNGHIPIITGGTGFYIQAVLYDVEFSDEDDDRTYRTELEKTAKEQGSNYLHHILEELDPESAAIIHPNNQKRIIRALEYLHSTGGKISAHNSIQHERKSRFDHAYFVLERERSTVYERINSRVDKMLDLGLVDEVRELLCSGISPQCQAMQGIGYKEIISYLNGNITYDEARDLIKKNSRHYAKRQNTWFKREKDIIHVRYEDFKDNNEILLFMTDILKQKGIINV